MAKTQSETNSSKSQPLRSQSHHGNGGELDEVTCGISEEDDDDKENSNSAVTEGTSETREARGKNLIQERTEKEEHEGDEEVSDGEVGEENDEDEGSSDMDAQACEKRSVDLIDDLGDIENQFAILREQLYRERVKEVEAKLIEVRAGNAPEFLHSLKDLQRDMEKRLEEVEVLRNYRLNSIQCKFDAEMAAAKQNFENDKVILLDSIKADLDENILKLEEDRHNVEITNGLLELSSGRSNKRNVLLDSDRRKKPVAVKGPYLVYMLKEADIMDDWAAIKKASSQRKKN